MTSTRQRLTVALVVISTLAACAGNDDDAVGTRPEIGPRAVSADHSAMMILDSIDVASDDVFVRLRVVNGSADFLNVEAEGTRYAALLVMRDDRDNTYTSLAVEPAGIDGHQIGRLGFRLHGPLDPDSEEFTLELGTNRGPLTTEPIAAPDGDEVRWWTEAPPTSFTDLVVTDQSGRSVQVFDIADLGTEVAVNVEVTDTSSGLSVPDDAHATLTLPGGTMLESLEGDGEAGGRSDEIAGVLRFVGALPTGPDPVSLNMAGIDVEIPVEQPPTPEAEPPVAGPAVLPDLLDRKLSTEPLPASTVATGSTG